MLGGLTVDYSGAQTEITLADGLYVEVKSTQPLTGSTLIASKVEMQEDGKKGEAGTEGEELELQGVVTTGLSGEAFGLNGQTVMINGDTEFEHGTDASLLAGTFVKMEGEFNQDGVLVAKSVNFENEGDNQIKAFVTSKGDGTINVLGLTININNSTTMVDEQDEGVVPVRYFSLADIHDNDYVQLDVYRDDAGNLIATRLQRDDAAGHVTEVQAKLDAEITAGDARFTLLGVTVITNGHGIDALSGDEITVQGDFNNGALTASVIGN